MPLDVDALATALGRTLGAGDVQQAPGVLRACAVDGVTPRLRCAPADADGIAAALRICAERGAAVIPWGGGTAMHWGNVPRRADVVLSLERLAGVVEHDDANLTATVRAGTPVAALQETLAGRRQFLAVDPPFPQRATAGGIAAANTNGPRRMAYGGVRDQVIGMKMVLAGGAQIKAGGKVVKNVAGYDMCKLFVGSLGTLGIITEITVRMAPLPEAARTVVSRGTLAQAAQLVDALWASTLTPAAVTILGGDVAGAGGPTAGAVSVAVWAEGFEEAVARHVRDVQAMAAGCGMTAEVLEAAAHRRLWDAVRDFGADAAFPVVFRLTVPLAAVAPALNAVSAMAGGNPLRYVAHAGAGTVWIALEDPAAAPAWFPRLTALAAEHRGHAVLAVAPPAVKRTVDVWGPPPAALSIMQELKRQFDPQGLLNPGRFVRGI